MAEIRSRFGSSHSWPSKPPSEARLRAQRANARLATGPKTREGRRRSALNRLAAKPKEIKWVWGGAEPRGHREFLRIWRDLRFLFGFVKPEYWREEPRLEIHLKEAARAWQSKLHAVCNGFSTGKLDADIESGLESFIFEYRLCNRKCDYWCRREFGAGGRELRKLRQGIEARMSSFHPRQMKEASAVMAPRQERSDRSTATGTSGEQYPERNHPPASLERPDRNQSPITFEDLGLPPYLPPFGPEFPRNRNQS